MSGLFQLRANRDVLDGYTRGLDTAITALRIAFPEPREPRVQALLDSLEEGVREARKATSEVDEELAAAAIEVAWELVENDYNEAERKREELAA